MGLFSLGIIKLIRQVFSRRVDIELHLADSKLVTKFHVPESSVMVLKLCC